MRVGHDVARDAVRDALADLWAAVADLDDRALLTSSRCHGWSVADVLVHVHLGLQEMLLGVVDPTDEAPDRDAATYWRDTVPRTDPDADELAGVRFVRLVASAYRRPAGVLGHLRPTLEGVDRAVAALPPGAVRFQGHVLASGDFLATWATELAVHHLDLGAGLALAPPAPAALALARATVEALAGGPLPASWSDADAVLRGSGRTPVPAAGGDTAGPSTAGPSTAGRDTAGRDTDGPAARLPVLG